MAESSMVSKLVAEFTGTFLLVFTIGCNVLGKTATWAGVSIACVLMVAIYSFGKISGANFNPAVSVTLGITKQLGGPGMDWKDVSIYSAVQIFAGITAGFCYFALFGETFNLGPAKGFGLISAGACELLYTFMLCFVVLNVAAAKKAANNEYYGLAIGFVIVAGAYGAGAVSGGCFNPAVAFGIDVSSAHLGFGSCLAYTVFQLLGACLAAGMFKVVRPQDFEEAGSLSSEEGSTLVSKLTCEFLGTFILVLTVGLNVLAKSPAGAFSIAASLMCMIYALGDISGAHFNPAVTFAIFCSRLCPELSAKDVGLYMISQVLGALVAVMAFVPMYSGQTFPLNYAKQSVFLWVQICVAEFVFTFVLCLVVLCAAVSYKTKSATMFGLAIGSCVTVGGFAIGGISGGALNPAVAIGVSVGWEALLFRSQLSHANLFVKILVYSAVEFLGAAAAAGVVKISHADTDLKLEDKDVEA